MEFLFFNNFPHTHVTQASLGHFVVLMLRKLLQMLMFLKKMFIYRDSKYAV